MLNLPLGSRNSVRAKNAWRYQTFVVCGKSLLMDVFYGNVILLPSVAVVC